MREGEGREERKVVRKYVSISVGKRDPSACSVVCTAWPPFKVNSRWRFDSFHLLFNETMIPRVVAKSNM